MEDNRNEGTVSVGNWMVTMLLMCIPVVNLIMLLVWAFGGGAEVSKANWAKASLIWMVIGIGLAVLMFMLFGAAMMGVMSQS